MSKSSSDDIYPKVNSIVKFLKDPANVRFNKITNLIKRHFDLRPYSIIKNLNLIRPIYLKTASYGHFGREEPEFNWEKTDQIQYLKN